MRKQLTSQSKRWKLVNNGNHTQVAKRKKKFLPQILYLVQLSFQIKVIKDISK